MGIMWHLPDKMKETHVADIMYNAYIDLCFAGKSNVVAKEAVSRWTGKSSSLLNAYTCNESGIKLQQEVD